MTMEEIENMNNFGPQVSGCLAKTPPKLEEPNPVLPCAAADVEIKYHPETGQLLTMWAHPHPRPPLEKNFNLP